MTERPNRPLDPLAVAAGAALVLLPLLPVAEALLPRTDLPIPALREDDR